MKKTNRKNLKNAKEFFIKYKIAIAICLVVFGIILIINPFEEKVNIVPSEVSKLTLVDYDGGNFTMKVPQGWVVETGGVDMFYAIRAHDPKDNRYQVFAILKAEPFLKSDKAKNWYESYYNLVPTGPNNVLAKAIVMCNPTVQEFYSDFNMYASYTKVVDTQYYDFNFPDLKNFIMLEQFESNSSMKNVSVDDKTIRGTFQDSVTGEKGQGLFMASIVNPGSYYTLGFDALFYSVYNVMGISAGDTDFVDYKNILTESINSLVYKDSFVNTTIANGNERTKSTIAINKSMSEAYSSYNNAWTNRQKTYDITSQKYSDATLGYGTRVIDTETGDIYKAYNGFLDDYKGKRYEAVTDDMYTESVKGYIEK